MGYMMLCLISLLVMEASAVPITVGEGVSTAASVANAKGLAKGQGFPSCGASSDRCCDLCEGPCETDADCCNTPTGPAVCSFNSNLMITECFKFPTFCPSGLP